MPKPKITCSICGRGFIPWRKKKFCSERCRKTDQNRRLGGMKGQSGTTLANSQNLEKIDEQNQEAAETARRDEPTAGQGEWIACNEVTRKFCRTTQSDAMGWTMRVEGVNGAGTGWIGAVHDARGSWK